LSIHDWRWSTNWRFPAFSAGSDLTDHIADLHLLPFAFGDAQHSSFWRDQLHRRFISFDFDDDFVLFNNVA
jgi:PHP family Zn ribbon phosphoesterase